MSKLTWSDDYAIGIDVIDRQHRRILDYINDIYDLPQGEDIRNDLANILHNLVDYTFSHFAFEEAMLSEVDYSELTEHQLTHQNFSSVIASLKQRFDLGEDNSIAEELALVLQSWLINHIKTEDAGYVATVKEKTLGVNQSRQENWVKKTVKRYFR